MNSILNLVKNPVLVEQDHETAIFRIYENRIFHVIVKKGQLVTMDIVNKGYEFIDAFGGGEFYNIFEFSSFADVDPEVRVWAASPLNNNYTIVDAIVINSFPQKILADFYIRYNKPVKPTRIFNSVEKAGNWINEIIERRDLKAG